jgi:hypothetical protein
MNVDRAGTFRAEVVDNGLGETKKSSLPQFIVNAKLTEYYDEDTETWVSWEEYGQEIDAYLCLFGMVGKKKELGTTLNYDQVCKVFNWDGADLQELAESKAGIKFQVRIEENDPEYADKTPYQVTWIDEYDANPSRKIKKLDKEEIKGLQAKYAALLKAKSKPAAPAKADKKPEPGVVTKKSKKEKIPPSPPAAPKVPPKAPSAVSTKPKTKQVDNYTKQKAWEAVVELKSADCDDEQLSASWQAAIHDVSAGMGEDTLDGEGWWAVKEKVLDEVGKF